MCTTIMRRSAKMSTVFANSPSPASELIDGNEELIEQESALSCSVSVNADRGRVFQVLTIAEYMEAWISIPGQCDDSPIHVACDAHGFRIRYYDEERMPATLTARYQTFRTARTTFQWSSSGDLDVAASIVKVRLQGDFARTTVSLTHSGLRSDEERLWHQIFWEMSLHKLCRLFQAPSPVRTEPMSARQRKRLIAQV